MPGTKLGFLD